jgi:hypothetical protein
MNDGNYSRVVDTNETGDYYMVCVGNEETLAALQTSADRYSHRA